LKHPPAEIQLDAETVRRLLDEQCPEFAGEPLQLVDEGWDNYTFLTGPSHSGRNHAARLPRREAAVVLVANEQRWLPLLAPRLPLAVPAPIFAGRPSKLFPWPWSVVTWIPGTTAERHNFGSTDTRLLAETLLALHQPAPADAPENPFRGVPLAKRNDAFGERLHGLHQHPGVDTARLAAIWREACAAPPARERRWLHGDLHPRNIVIREGALVGIIDWGDLAGGDVATDLACGWLLLGAERRREFLAAYGADEALVARAKGWAALMGLALLVSGESRHTPLGAKTLERVISGV
jgi:aminoglycoside phosphotransferase (APT) family kinase protein